MRIPDLKFVTNLCFSFWDTVIEVIVINGAQQLHLLGDLHPNVNRINLCQGVTESKVPWDFVDFLR